MRSRTIVESRHPTRRKVARWMLSAAGLAVAERAMAEAMPAIDQLQPGQFVWRPEQAPSGSVAVVVSLPDQRVYVYRRGTRIAVSTCSTGKAGHRTPTGVFSILQKDRNHRSSTYNNAPMPNMNRLTWSGVALHAGQLPGYPASHGCVRLPLAFSEKLFGITEIGTPVIIANAATYPGVVAHPGMVLSNRPQREFDAIDSAIKKRAIKVAARPDRPSTSSIVVSSADRKILIFDDGAVVADGTLTIADPDRPLGNHVFILSSVDAANQQLNWRSIGYYNDARRPLEITELATIQRLRGDNAIVEEMRARMVAGTVLLTVDEPLTADTRSSKGFVVMTTGDEA